MQTVTAGGNQLECRWWGRPDCRGPVLVLLHEGLGCVAMWKDFPALLHQRTNLDVFAYSRAGYGGSAPVELPRGIDYMHVEGQVVLGEVLEAAGIGEAIVTRRWIPDCGHAPHRERPGEALDAISSFLSETGATR